MDPHPEPSDSSNSCLLQVGEGADQQEDSEVRHKTEPPPADFSRGDFPQHHPSFCTKECCFRFWEFCADSMKTLTDHKSQHLVETTLQHEAMKAACRVKPVKTELIFWYLADLMDPAAHG
ncbi:uncharacterized protein ABDE67_008437 [Symphorus nematophorus]